MTTARERLADAALTLFEDRGYDDTTVDEIAERAGVGRSTFFRHHRSKEDAVFPDHDDLLRRVGERLESSGAGTAIAAVTDAVRLVLLHYVAEGERARRRYRLVTAIPALRNREIASVARYQRLFREFIDGWMGDEGGSALRAELMAASVVAAHNHVLRRHLRAETSDPVAEVEAALAQVVALFTPEDRQAAGGTTVIALTSDRPIADLLPDLRRVLGVEAAGTPS